MLGTFVEILISGDCGREVLLEYSECAYGIIQDIHDKMSFHSKESELSKINKCAFKGPVKISKELSDVLKTGAKVAGGAVKKTLATTGRGAMGAVSGAAKGISKGLSEEQYRSNIRKKLNNIK